MLNFSIVWLFAATSISKWFIFKIKCYNSCNWTKSYLSLIKLESIRLKVCSVLPLFNLSHYGPWSNSFNVLYSCLSSSFIGFDIPLLLSVAYFLLLFSENTTLEGFLPFPLSKTLEVWYHLPEIVLSWISSCLMLISPHLYGFWWAIWNNLFPFRVT